MRIALTIFVLALPLLGQVKKWPSTTRPVVRGRDYAVSSMRPEASMAAERILRAGGNAFDAVVAGQAVLGLNDAPNNGIGGDAQILLYDAKSGKPYSLNGEGTAPKLATIDWYKKNHKGTLPSSDTLLSGTVPGVIDSWYVMLDRWGTMTFAEVLAPVIDLAENGFPMADKLASAINGSKKLAKYPSSVALYKPDGKVWKGGDMFTNRDLARTFRRLIAAEKAASHLGRQAALKAARDEFYKGAIAREMAKFSEENGGLFRYDDFAEFQAQLETPISVNYRGYTVLKNPSASQGPAELFALNILENFDLKKMGHNSADYIHTSIEAIKLAMADREYIGDELVSKVPYEQLLSKRYAAERAKLIDPAKASMDFRQGKPDASIPTHPQDVNFDSSAGDNGDTSYICVIDKHRNAVSFTPSLHSGFGTNVVMGKLGFSFNCRGDYYSLIEGHPNALAPGKRPRSTLQGTLVLKDGKPFLVTGSPGGDDQCLRTMQTLLNIVEFGMNPQQAIEAARYSTRSFPMSYWPHRMYRGEATVEDRVAEEVRAELKKRGHLLKVNGPWSLGLNAAIMVDSSNILHSAADPRADAYALAW
ncbi:MAG: gamma-glutamyltransferase [Bryobacterales bacterium]|nr:gamma-glutamyltransferase [Bryobacterales bacterium]